jgi:hypothetical protein
MYSKRVSILFVAVLVVLAGCAGGGGAASDTGDADSASSGTGGESAVDAGSGSSGGASGDAETLELSDPERLLRDAGSFTTTWSYEGVDATGTEQAVAREFYADLDGGRSYTVTSSDDGGAVEQFVADGVTYTRTGAGDTAVYSAYEGSTDVIATAVSLSQARAYGVNDGMELTGSETFDGVRVDRYELTAANEALVLAGAATAAESADEIEVTSFEYVVLVDEDGLSRSESWSFAGRTSDGTEVRGSWKYSLTAVGSTTVDDPDWLADARAQRVG